MEITKLFLPPTEQNQFACVQIHSNTYCSDYKHIQMLVTELRKDFTVKDEDIKIHKYCGNRVSGITFIECFLSGVNKIPDGYQKMTRLEFIL